MDVFLSGGVLSLKPSNMYRTVSASVFIQWFSHKINSKGIYNRGEYRGHVFDFSIPHHKIIFGVNAVLLLHILFNKVGMHPASLFTVEYLGIQVWGPPAQHVFGCHVKLFTPVSFEYVPYQKGVIQGHTAYCWPTRETIGLCPRTFFQATNLPDVGWRTHFLYHMSVKELFVIFVSISHTVCYAKKARSIQLF